MARGEIRVVADGFVAGQAGGGGGDELLVVPGTSGSVIAIMADGLSIRWDRAFHQCVGRADLEEVAFATVHTETDGDDLFGIDAIRFLEVIATDGPATDFEGGVHTLRLPTIFDDDDIEDGDIEAMLEEDARDEERALAPVRDLVAELAAQTAATARAIGRLGEIFRDRDGEGE